MSELQFIRLLPGATTTEPTEDVVSSLQQFPPAPADRPYLIANFVSSADGRATVQGRSGALGDDGDRAIFHALRERADAILAGTVTYATERYGRLLGKQERRERRRAAGHPAEPLAVMITRTGKLPPDIPILTEPEARIAIFSPTAPELDGAKAQITVEPCDPDDPRPLTSAMHTLRTKHDVELLLCEGGPTLFGALLLEDLVDELFLTLAPKLAGGTGPPITAAPPLPKLVPLRLAALLEHDNALYLRYRLER
jgi:riboflavin biosynthesis pyrimidine reductase